MVTTALTQCEERFVQMHDLETGSQQDEGSENLSPEEEKQLLPENGDMVAKTGEISKSIITKVEKLALDVKKVSEARLGLESLASTSRYILTNKNDSPPNDPKSKERNEIEETNVNAESGKKSAEPMVSHGSKSIKDFNEAVKGFKSLITTTENLLSKIANSTIESSNAMTSMMTRMQNERKSETEVPVKTGPANHGVSELPQLTKFSKNLTHPQTKESGVITRDTLEKAISDILGKQLENQGMKNSENSGACNVLGQIKDTLKIELINKEFNIKRDYKLTRETKFEQFYDLLSNELRNNDLLYVIDSKVKTKITDENILERHRFRVREVLINHIDQTYHAKVLHLDDPVKILQEIRNIKRCESNKSSVSVRNELHDVRQDGSS